MKSIARKIVGPIANIFGFLSRKLTEFKLNKEFQKALIDLRKDPLMGLHLDLIKSKFGNNFFELKEIINKHDPMGLIEMGAPDNEYEPEIKTIIVQLKDVKNENILLDLVYCEFEKWFGNAGKKENYIGLAKDIYEWKSKL